MLRNQLSSNMYANQFRTIVINYKEIFKIQIFYNEKSPGKFQGLIFLSYKVILNSYFTPYEDSAAQIMIASFSARVIKPAIYQLSTSLATTFTYAP